MDHLCFFMSGVYHAFASVHCWLVVTCLERTGLLALLCDVALCFATFPCGILGQVWYLIVCIPEICRLSYLNKPHNQTVFNLDL